MDTAQPIKGVYFPSWSSSDPRSIDTKLFTHIYYAFLNPNATFQIHIEQPERLLNFTSTLHAMNPPLKTLLSIGGYSAGTDIFSALASHASSRATFIRSTIQVSRRYGFDGVDLDWEFPPTSEDMANLGLLLREWRVEVQREAADTGRAPLLLVAAVYFSPKFPWGKMQAYPAPSISASLDWINVMNYDYHGSWDKSATGAHAALFDPDPDSVMTTSYGLNSWIQAGVPCGKLVMGLPLFGKTWLLKDRRHDGVGADADNVGPGEDGVLTYAQVLEFNRNNGAKVVFDEATVSMYSVAGNTWVGYDDARSVREKISYARGLGLRGYFFWDMDGDCNWTISKTASNMWSR